MTIDPHDRRRLHSDHDERHSSFPSRRKGVGLGSDRAQKWGENLAIAIVVWGMAMVLLILTVVILRAVF